MDREQLQARYGDEQVLVIPTDAAENLPNGISELNEQGYVQLVAASRFIPRWEAEYNPAWRQLIPYIVLRQDSRLLLTRRTKSQGEARLHSLYSLGVGGHINPCDADQSDLVAAGMQRELTEELQLGDWLPGCAIPAGIINDLSNEVSRDHLGILYLLDVPADVQIAVREQDKMTAEWKPKADLPSIKPAMESWSQLVLDWILQA